MQVNLQTEIEDIRWNEKLPDIESVIESVKNATFKYVAEHDDMQILSVDKPLKVNLCLSNDVHVQQLNRDFRHKDMPTNVLSFANIDFDEFDMAITIDIPVNAPKVLDDSITVFLNERLYQYFDDGEEIHNGSWVGALK